ncbi:MAG: hypothetical protein AB7S77_20845 [Desulfatirhabdiaceae bacterium]
MVIKKCIVFVSLVMALFLFTGTAFCQDTSTDTFQIFIEKIRADKKLFVATVMELTDAEGKAFWPVYDSYQKELQKINEAMGTLIGNFAKNYKEMSEQTAESLIQDSLKIDEKRMQLKKDFLPQFSKAIPKTKVLRYFQLENKIQLALHYELSVQIPLLR